MEPQQPPYHQYPPQYGMPYVLPPPRSAIPRVVGIIGIVLSVIGLLSSGVFGFGPLSDIRRWGSQADLSTVTTWLYGWMALSLVIFALHFVGSILAIMYKPTGSKLLTSYAVSAMVLIVIDMVMCHGFVTRGHDFDIYGSVTISHTVYSGIAFPWPVVVLALINSKRAREACS
jgi:hypothetical protein